jgi:hypothetical protein
MDLNIAAILDLGINHGNEILLEAESGYCWQAYGVRRQTSSKPKNKSSAEVISTQSRKFFIGRSNFEVAACTLRRQFNSHYLKLKIK